MLHEEHLIRAQMIVNKNQRLERLTTTPKRFPMALSFSTLYKEFFFEEERLTTTMMART